jgi:hypothetical protein
LGIWKAKRGKIPLNVSHESIERIYTSTFAEERELIKEEQEEVHFSRKEWHKFLCKGGHGNRGKYQQLMTAITSPYGTDLCTEIEASVQH